MNPESIKKIFNDYLDEERTNHAILLNGVWGSGKTHFWKYSLQEIAKQKDYKTIYLSLNGISKIENLEHELFIKLLPLIGQKENKLAKNTITLLTNLINQLGKVFIKSSLSDIFQGISIDSFNFSRYMICFDDLERCQMPVKEVFGFINDFVEHKHLKTIILADECNIDPSHKEVGYDNIKEKVIGRVLNFNPDVKEILPQIFLKYSSGTTGFYDFIIANQQKIIDIFHEYDINNLRIITFYLDSLSRIAPVLKKVKEKYINEIIFFTAIISNEFKIGGLKSVDYPDFKGLDNLKKHYSLLAMSPEYRDSQNEKNNDKQKTYIENFNEKYLKDRIEEYYFYPSICTYILTGYLDLKMLEYEIKERYSEIVSEEIKDFRKLLNYTFRELSNDEQKKF